MAVAGPSALDLVEVLVDPSSFEEWDADVTSPAPAPDPLEYVERLARSRARVPRRGADSALTGSAAVEGHPVALSVGEFAFMGGSMGLAAGERIVRALHRATRDGLPVVALLASGGVRMHEGTPAFLQMVRVAEAVRGLREAGRPYLVYLRDPVMGGTYASLGSLGTVTLAEPGARIGFTGPRVLEGMGSPPVPAQVQSAEHLLGCGVLDGLVEAAGLRSAIARLLSALAPASEAGPEGPVPPEPEPGDAWESVRRSRDPSRPGARELVGAMAEEATFLGGADAPGGACLLGIVRIGGVPTVVVGEDRAHGGAVDVAAFRRARRGIRMAQDLGIALVTIVDTPGRSLSATSEERGLAGEISGCLVEMLATPAVTVSVLLGEGGGGTALALLPADRVVAAEHAWLAPLPPEGAAVLVFGDADRAAEMARHQRISAVDLRRLGVVDRVVPEAPRDAPGTLAWLSGAVGRELRELESLDPRSRLDRRRARYARLPASDRPPA